MPILHHIHREETSKRLVLPFLIWLSLFLSFLPFTFSTIYIYAFSRHFYPKRLTVHSGYTFFCQYVCSLGIEPTTFALANTMLYHWATGTLKFSLTSEFTSFTFIWTPLNVLKWNIVGDIKRKMWERNPLMQSYMLSRTLYCPWVYSVLPVLLSFKLLFKKNAMPSSLFCQDSLKM